MHSSMTTELGQQVTVSKLIAIHVVVQNSRSRSLVFFVVRFVAKPYILQKKCQKGQIGTLMLGARWNNF